MGKLKGLLFIEIGTGMVNVLLCYLKIYAYYV